MQKTINNNKQKKSKKGMYFVSFICIALYTNLFLLRNLSNKIIPLGLFLILIPLLKVALFYVITKLKVDHKQQLKEEYYKKQQALVKSKTKVKTEYKIVPFPVPNSMFQHKHTKVAK